MSSNTASQFIRSSVLDEEPFSQTYSKTAKGLAELRSKESGLSSFHLGVLQCVDGHSSGSQIAEKYPAVSKEAMTKALQWLEKFGYIRRLPSSLGDGLDRPSSSAVTVTELAPAAAIQIWAEARRINDHLAKYGFYAEKDLSLAREKILTALVVDDDPAINEFVALLLAQKGFAVQAAATAAQALEALRTALPDFVILDVMLPDLDGFSVLKKIRATPETSLLPVIMLTALKSDENIMNGLRNGADGYICKPFQKERLLECVEQILF